MMMMMMMIIIQSLFFYNLIHVYRKALSALVGLALNEYSKTEMTASVQGNKSKHTRGLKMNALLNKTMCEFSVNFAFDKATNGQTDIKHKLVIIIIIIIIILCFVLVVVVVVILIILIMIIIIILLLLSLLVV